MTGRRYERKLVNLLDEAGFEIMKSPSSGSGTTRDQPDLLAGSARIEGLPPLAIEAKSTRSDAYTIREAEAEQLRRFAENFGAVPVIAMYWKGPPGGNVSYGGWWFMRLSGVRRSPQPNSDGGYHLRPRRDDRHEWAQTSDLREARLTARKAGQKEKQ